MPRTHDYPIWLQTLAVVGLCAAAVWGVYETWLGGLVESTVLGLVLAFAFVQSVVIGALLVGLVVAKAVVGSRERQLGAVTPVVREWLVDWLTETDPRRVDRARDEIGTWTERLPEAVERCAVEMLASISGSELDRLAGLLVETGIVDRWRARYRARDAERRRVVVEWLGRLPGQRGNGVLREALDDGEPSVRIEAARGLLKSGRIGDIERVFRFAVGEPLLVRAVLVEDLKPFAIHLAEQAVPRTLAGNDPREALVVLEMLEGWQKSLSVAGVASLYRHPRPEVRARALRVAPYVSGTVDVEREVLAGLGDDDREVRAAAARAAGRLGVAAAIPALERLLHTQDRDVAVAAAYALAALGETGADRLLAAVRANHSPAAAVALEALERVRTDRLHLARV